MKVLAIDPGNIYSAYCVINAETLRPLEFGKIKNTDLSEFMEKGSICRYDDAVIEMVASYGMPVGDEVFETVSWIGEYTRILRHVLNRKPAWVKRMEVKMHICHNSRARDSNIRAALIERFARHDKKNGKGTKKFPDFFYGFKADIWAAYAVGITYIETRMEENK